MEAINRVTDRYSFEFVTRNGVDTPTIYERVDGGRKLALHPMDTVQYLNESFDIIKWLMKHGPLAEDDEGEHCFFCCVSNHKDDVPHLSDCPWLLSGLTDPGENK